MSVGSEADTPKPAAAGPPLTGWHAIASECAEWAGSDKLKRLTPSQLRLAAGARLLHAQGRLENLEYLRAVMLKYFELGPDSFTEV